TQLNPTQLGPGTPANEPPTTGPSGRTRRTARRAWRQDPARGLSRGSESPQRALDPCSVHPPFVRHAARAPFGAAATTPIVAAQQVPRPALFLARASLPPRRDAPGCSVLEASLRRAAAPEQRVATLPPQEQMPRQTPRPPKPSRQHRRAQVDRVRRSEREHRVQLR